MEKTDQQTYDFYEYLWGTGQRGEAERVACEYVELRRSRIGPLLEQFSLEQLVALVDAYNLHLTNVGPDGKRVAHEEGPCSCRTDRIIVDMWLHSEYSKQNIFGQLNVNPADLAQSMVNALNRGDPLT